MVLALCICTIIFSSLRIGSMARSTLSGGYSLFADIVVLLLAVVVLVGQLK